MALDLPQGHWMHAALKKEQARVAKQKTATRQTGKGPAPAPMASPASAGPVVATPGAPVTPMGGQAPMQRPVGPL